MSEGFDKPKDLIFWNKRLLRIVGMWPLEYKPFIFYPWLLYSSIHLCLALADLVRVSGDMTSVIANLGETAYLVVIMSKMMVMRYSSTLRTFMRQVASSENEVNYKNEEERKIYMSYTRAGVRFFKIVIWTTASATTIYYLKTLKIYFETDTRTYFLIYAYQGPMVYMSTCHGILACFVWSLLIDVCGQLSVLAFRIKNIQSNSFEKDKCLESVLRDIVQKHKKIIWNSKVIDGAFNIALLVELITCTVIMGLCIYNIITNSDFSDAIEFISFFLYISMMLVIMYGYCVAGDYLVQQSLNVRDSYYECDWYNMPPNCKQTIIMCMIRTRIPLQITGGGFYIYTMESLTGVIKTAMTYGSMLRQLA